MAEQVKQVRQVKKERKEKKKWVTIVSPKLFNNRGLGESYCYDTKSLVGRNINVSLMSVTDDPKKQSIEVSFKINDVKNDTLHTELIGYEILPVHVRRMSKKAKMKVEDSFSCVCKDGVKVRIKPLIMTKDEVHNSVATSIRKAVHTFIADYLKQNSFEDSFKGIVNNDLQKNLKDVIKKVYPINSCMIRVFKRER